jgi:hypothetical protein
LVSLRYLDGPDLEWLDAEGPSRACGSCPSPRKRWSSRRPTGSRPRGETGAGRGELRRPAPAERGVAHRRPVPGQRKFDVALEGTTVLDDFDVFAAAGGKNVALDRSFTTTVADGTLDLAFTTVVNGATVSAIEVEPVGAPTWATTTQSYRADGLRHGKTAGGATTTYTWDVNAGLPVVLQDGANTYVYGLGGSLVSQTDGAGSQSYVLGDGLGSTRALTDGAGAVTATYDYSIPGSYRNAQAGPRRQLPTSICHCRRACWSSSWRSPRSLGG